MNEPISEESERRITVAIAVAFVALIPSAILGGLLWHEVDTRTDSNKALIEEQTRLVKQIQKNEVAQEKLRVEARAAIRAADISNCEEDEVVKSRLREIVRFNPEELNLTLETLGIDPQSARGKSLFERSKRNADEAVNALRPRDCTMLPDPADPFEKG